MNDYYLKDYHPSTLSLIPVTTYLSDRLTWICNITFVPDYALNNIWKAWNNYYISLLTIKGPSYFDHSCIWFSECPSSIQVLTLMSTHQRVRLHTGILRVSFGEGFREVLSGNDGRIKTQTLSWKGERCNI